MRTCEDGCNGCDKCTDYEDQGHRPPRFLRDEHDIAAFSAEQADPALKPDIAALTKRMAEDPQFAAQVTGEQAAMQPELALFFRDLRNHLLHVIDMSKGEHYLDVVRLNAQALIRRMELLAATAHPVAPAGWKLVPLELTPEMRMAFHAVVDTVELGVAGSRWAAMLAAAPAQPAAL